MKLGNLEFTIVKKKKKKSNLQLLFLYLSLE